MRLVQLAANLLTEQGADTNAQFVQKYLGSQPSGVGPRDRRRGDLEATTAGRHAHGLRHHPTLAELKRYLKAHGKYRGILGLLGRDP